MNDRINDASDDGLSLAAQARQQGGWFRLALLALAILLGVAVLLVLILASGSYAGT
ncbi:MAG TPA: hypothetical protein VFI22_13140 [Thermomicrobiales bacterium]|nr:hypothetical protein [Thermomicrobiales bacterium]